MTAERETPSPEPRFLRSVYCVIQAGAFVVFGILCWITKKFEEIYDQLGMTDLPVPTVLFLLLARFARSPIGMATFSACLIVLVVLARRGTFDERLKKLIWGNFLGLFGLTGFITLAIFLPIIKIQETLNTK
jgi:type II secretory pathway component PulF